MSCLAQLSLMQQLINAIRSPDMVKATKVSQGGFHSTRGRRSTNLLVIYNQRVTMRAGATLVVSLLTVCCAHPASPSSTPSMTTSAAPAHAQQIEKWRQSHKTEITTLGQALTDLGEAMTANDWNAIHLNCSKLPAASRPMRDALPSPDDRLNAAFNGMLDNVGAAASECASLNAGSDEIDAHSFIRHLALAEDDEKTVEAILK